jgi:hypothetical protein
MRRRHTTARWCGSGVLGEVWMAIEEYAEDLAEECERLRNCLKLIRANAEDVEDARDFLAYTVETINYELAKESLFD